jgi:hypothetical protein
MGNEVEEALENNNPFEGVTEAIIGGIVIKGGEAWNEIGGVLNEQVDTSFNVISQYGENLADNIITSVEVDLDADYELQTGSSQSYVVFNPFKPQVTSLPIIYGTRETPGKLIFQETNADPGEFLYRYYAISEGPVTSISPVTSEPEMLKDTTLQGTGTSNWFYRTYLGADVGINYVTAHGTQEQDFRYGWVKTNTIGDPKPVSWSIDHKCKGFAVVFHRFKYGQVTSGGTDYVLNKAPKITHTVDGITLSGNNDNPANQLKDYLTNSRYGAGIDSSKIDTSSFDNVRDYCDEVSGGKKRFTCNIILNPQNAVLDNVKFLLQSFMGQLHFRGGKYYLYADQPFSGTPVVNFSTSNLLGGIAISQPTKEIRFNQCIVTYFDSENSYKPAEAVWPNPNNSGEDTILNNYLSIDGNESLIKRVSISGCTDFNVARHIAQILVRKSRSQTTVSISTTAESANCIPGDIVTLTWASLSWSSKQFRVREISLGQYGSMNLILQEHDNNFYNRDIKTAPSTVANVTVGFPNIGQVSSLTATESVYSTRDGSGVKSKVTLSFTGVTSNFLDRYVIDYKLSSASTYQPSFDSQETSVELLDFGVGSYDFRVRARRLDGVLGTATTVSLTTTGLGEPPVKIEGLFVNSMGTMALLQWTLSSDLDVVQGGFYSIKHSVDTGASSWSQGIRIADNVAGHQNSAIVPLLAGVYMIRAHDSSGQVSMPTFINSTGASLQALQLDSSVQEDPDFLGTMNRMSNVDDLLKIESEDELDSISNFDNITRFDALNGIWNTSSSGYDASKPQYTFTNTMDLGSVKTTRLRQFIKSNATSVFDLIDSRVANIDTWEDFDDTEADFTSVKMQVRSTNDNPSSSPSWGDWSDFYVEERTARAHQFRIFPETTNSNYNLNITQMRVFAETLS